MRRTWIAALSVILLALTAAAFVDERMNTEATLEEIPARLIDSNEAQDNSHGLLPEDPVETRPPFFAHQEAGGPLWSESQPAEPDDDDGHKAFLEGSEKDELLPALFSTGPAQWPGLHVNREQGDGRFVPKTMSYSPKGGGKKTYTAANSNTNAHAFAYTDRYQTCTVEDTYDEGETTCYVDSVNGSDTNNGLSEATPVKSQAAIHASCTVVRLKRGSVFNEKLAIPTYFNNVRFGYNVKVYTNYGPQSDPLPHFRVSSEPGRGPVVLSFKPLTIDGLHFSGARGDNTMEHDFDFDRDGITKGIVGGIGAFLGAATTFINNEIDECDMGIMLGAEGSLVRGNYIHDLIMGIDDDPGVDPNLVGGAEGIFINASNNEVSYNSVINCTGPARWVGSNGVCDGGATEVSAASGGTIQNVHVHHNFSYNSCGFFEVASYFGDRGKGFFKDSSFHNNVIVDSAWMGLLQVNNTNLENIHFYNNTLIQHPGSLNAGILWIIFTAESSGMSDGELVPGTVYLTNNLYVLDGIFRPRNWLIDSAFDERNDLFVSYSGPQDPNYVDLGFANIAGNTLSDFDLVNSDSPAVDAGAYIAENTLDYFNRERPNGNASDIGAMEFSSTQVECMPRFPAPSLMSRPPLKPSHGANRDAVPRRGPKYR